MRKRKESKGKESVVEQIVKQPRMIQPEGSDLHQRQLPLWFDDAKFGIFIHWGVYSVPAFAPTKKTSSISLNCAEWYLRKLKMPFRDFSVTRKHHSEVYGKDFKYDNFAPMWKAEKWDPCDWADLFASIGARYIVFTAKHHDGFCNWPTESPSSNSWSVFDNGPRRDLVGELKLAVEKRNIHFGLYYSLFEWYNKMYLADKRSLRMNKPLNTPNFVNTVVFPQLKELVERYKPHVLWCDGDWEQESSYWRATEFLGWLYNASPVSDVVACNDRWGKDAKTKFGCFSNPIDRFSPTQVLPYKWECCFTIGTSWGYNSMEQSSEYLKSSEEIILMLVKTVCRGGNFLLNVGPLADGTIPLEQKKRLLEVGEWMNKYGDSIYKTQPCKKPCESSIDFWYTQNKSDGALHGFLLSFTGIAKVDGVHYICLDNIAPRGVGGIIKSVATDEECVWEHKDHGILIKLPENKLPAVFKFDGFTTK